MKTFASFFGIVIAFSAILMTHTSCAQEWDKVDIEATPITDHVYMLTGSGGNIGVLINDDHILVIDSQFDPLYDKIVARIAELSDKPIRFLVNTHWHIDHTSGNASFDADNATIIAHENVKTRLESGGRIDFMNRDVPPVDRPHLPDLTFYDRAELDLGSETIHLVYVDGAHTDGDALVYLERNNVLHAGDAIFGVSYPFIDLSSGGTIDGHIAACKRILELADDETAIISGHSVPNTRAEIESYLAMVTTVTEYVRAAIADGKDLKAVVDGSEDMMKAYDATYARGFIDSRSFLSFIFNSL